jgi:hypothetical protein
VFQGVIDVAIPLGQVYAKAEGVSAQDHDGTDLTASMTVSGLFNYNKAGVYVITFRVTGASGVEVVATRSITVIENAFITTTGVSIVLDAGDAFDPLEGVYAFDGDNTDITEQLIVLYPENYDLNVAGDYVITYQITGKNGVVVSVDFTVTVVAPQPVSIVFGSIETPTDGSVVLSRTMAFDPLAGVFVKDYDGEDMKHLVQVEGVVDIYAVGSYTLTYKATGKNGIETVVTRSIEVVDRYVEIDGNRFPVDSSLINPTALLDNNAWTKGAITILTSIPREFSTSAIYPVVAIVDGNGRIVYVRDPFLSVNDLSSPIRTFQAATPFNAKDQSLGGSTAYTNTTMFKGLTDADIPEGGFVMVFSYTEGAPTDLAENHPARKFGLDMARRIGALVTIYGFEIPGYTQKTNEERIVFEGVADQYLLLNQAFDPMAGVSARLGLDAADIVVQASTVDTTVAGFYYVLYKASFGGKDTYYARRVIVAASLANATIVGGDVIWPLGKPVDLKNLVKVFEFSRELINYKATVIAEDFDFTKEGVYSVTYSVTGQNGIEVSKTIQVTVTSNPIIKTTASAYTITVGDPFDVTTVMTAVDYDGSVVQVEISAYDITVIGTVDITITATGKFGVKTHTVALTVLGPKPVLTVVDDFSHVINTPLDIQLLATALDHNQTPLTPAFVIERKIDGVYQTVESVDTSILGAEYRITFTAVGEYQNVSDAVLFTIIDPLPVLFGVEDIVVYVGDAYDPFARIHAVDAFGQAIANESILFTYAEGISGIDTATAAVFAVTVSVSVDYEGQTYTTTKTMNVHVVDKPAAASLFVGAIQLPATATIVLNGTIAGGTAAASTVWVFDWNATLPITIPNTSGAPANTASGMMILDKDGYVRLARFWFKVNNVEYMEEISVDRNKLALTGAISANGYFAVNPVIGNLKGNIILNGGTASTWSLAEGERLVVFGGSGAVTTSMASWLRATANPHIGTLVQFYNPES